MFYKVLVYFKKLFITFYNVVIDIIYPKKCLKCGELGSYLCPICRDALPLNPIISCYLCHKPNIDGQVCSTCRNKYHPPVKGILIASDWKDETLQKVIKNLKYKFVRELSEVLGNILSDFLIIHWGQISWLNTQRRIYFCPIPLHHRRLIERGFNQSELIARQMADSLKKSGYWLDNFRYADDLLIRKKYSRPQAEIKNILVRRKNIQGAFSTILPTASPSQVDADKTRISANRMRVGADRTRINIEDVQGQVVILIDDVVTTGATVEEAARALKPLRPKEIWGLAVARG